MSDMLEAAVRALEERIGGGFDGTVRFSVREHGTIIVDGSGARVGDGEAEVTLSADAGTFRAMLEGSLSPASAFMSGQLEVEGDMSVAIRLGSAIV